MNDAGPRRDHAEAVERLLRPPQEGIALAVPLELELDVAGEGAGRSEGVHLDGMVDDEVDGDLRIDGFGVAAEPIDGCAQRGEVGDGRYAGEVLEHDARGVKGEFLRRSFGEAEQQGDMLRVGSPTLVTEDVLEEHPHDEGEPGDPLGPCGLGEWPVGDGSGGGVERADEALPSSRTQA